MNRFSGEERDLAIALYTISGLTLRQVGDRIGWSPYAVRCALIDAGIPRRSATLPTITADERAEMVRLYAVDRLSTHVIADRLGRAQSAVWKIIAAAGVPRRPAGWPTRHRTEDDPVPFVGPDGPIPGYVAGRCGHRVAQSEWRAGFRVCERCPDPSYREPDSEGQEWT